MNFPSLLNRKIPRRWLQITADRINLHHMFIPLIKPVNLYLIQTRICCHHKLAVRRPSKTGNVGTEISICHTSQSLMEHAVYNLTYAPVSAQPKNRSLAIVETGNKYILTFRSVERWQPLIPLILALFNRDRLPFSRNTERPQRPHLQWNTEFYYRLTQWHKRNYPPPPHSAL